MVVDTHALVWYLTDPDQLSIRARAVFGDADRGQRVAISSITLIELVYIAEKRRDGIDPAVVSRVLDILDSGSSPITVAPVTPDVVRQLMSIDRGRVRDPFDRTIVATALALGMPLLTKDRLLSAHTADRRRRRERGRRAGDMGPGRDRRGDHMLRRRFI